MNEKDIASIKAEQKMLRESGLPSQAQIKQSQVNSKIFANAQKAYKDLLAFFKKWDREVGNADPNDKQLAAAEAAYKKALKDIKPFWDSDSNAQLTHGTAAQKLLKQTQTTLDGIKWMIYGD